MKKQTKEFWLATRDGEPCGSFDTRREAVKWLKKLLNQELKDFSKQDRTDEYDYPVNISRIEIKRYDERQDYLGV